MASHNLSRIGHETGGRPAGTRIHRRYHGKTLIVIEDGLLQGFIFEPGEVILDYVADNGSHPRDPRLMTMTITGTGRMAAALKLLQQEDQHDHDDDEHHQLPLADEVAALPAPIPHD